MPVVTEHRTFATGVNLAERVRIEVIELLNARLADAIDLKTQAKQAHWNVKGMNSASLHELFDRVATHLNDQADTIAERITALGGIALGTARVVASTSSLREYDLNAVTGEQHVRALARGLAQLGNAARSAINRAAELGDQVTSDVFTGIAREADKDLWFLEAHLQG